VIVSAVEHPSVREAASLLEKEGVERVEIPVDAEGRLDLVALARALQKPATLVSVMAVNNETGVILSSQEAIRLAKASGVLIHVDAVQAAGRVALPLEADLISISGHKLGGPKGVGALLTRTGIRLAPSIVGGPQERGHRAGTEPVALAVGLATALEVAIGQLDQEARRLLGLSRRIEAPLGRISGVRVLGEKALRVPQTVTALFDGVAGETLLLALDLEGIAASSGSACSSGSLEPSHVLLAMGVPKNRALAAVRFSLGWASTEADVERLDAVLPGVLERVRAAT
jgi:cysteine desulfurase